MHSDVRSPDTARNGRAWAVAALAPAVLSGAMLGLRIAFDGDTFQHCDYLGPSTRMWITAWAGPVLALAALAALAVAARRGRAAGGRLIGHRLDIAAAVAGCLVPVMLLVQCALLYWTLGLPAHAPGCEGLVVVAGA